MGKCKKQSNKCNRKHSSQAWNFLFFQLFCFIHHVCSNYWFLWSHGFRRSSESWGHLFHVHHSSYYQLWKSGWLPYLCAVIKLVSLPFALNLAPATIISHNSWFELQLNFYCDIQFTNQWNQSSVWYCLYLVDQWFDLVGQRYVLQMWHRFDSYRKGLPGFCKKVLQKWHINQINPRPRGLTWYGWPSLRDYYYPLIAPLSWHVEC